MQIRKAVTFLFVMTTTILVSAVAFAEGAEGGTIADRGLQLIAAAIAIGVAAAGGAVGQGKAAAAALEGIARNPNASGKVFTPMILGLALIESLVIYALIIAFMILGK